MKNEFLIQSAHALAKKNIITQIAEGFLDTCHFFHKKK